LFTCRRPKNSATTPPESFAVEIRTALEICCFDANAIFAYELLTSINK